MSILSLTDRSVDRLFGGREVSLCSWVDYNIARQALPLINRLIMGDARDESCGPSFSKWYRAERAPRFSFLGIPSHAKVDGPFEDGSDRNCNLAGMVKSCGVRAQLYPLGAASLRHELEAPIETVVLDWITAHDSWLRPNVGPCSTCKPPSRVRRRLTRLSRATKRHFGQKGGPSND